MFGAGVPNRVEQNRLEPKYSVKKNENFIKRYISSSNCVYECDRHKSGFFLGREMGIANIIFQMNVGIFLGLV